MNSIFIHTTLKWQCHLALYNAFFFSISWYHFTTELHLYPYQLNVWLLFHRGFYCWHFAHFTSKILTLHCHFKWLTGGFIWSLSGKHLKFFSNLKSSFKVSDVELNIWKGFWNPTKVFLWCAIYILQIVYGAIFSTCLFFSFNLWLFVCFLKWGWWFH